MNHPAFPLVLLLSPSAVKLLQHDLGNGSNSSGLADEDDNLERAYDYWFEREQRIRDALDKGVLRCEDDDDIRLVKTAFESSTYFAGVDEMKPHQKATMFKIGYTLQEALQSAFFQAVNLPPELS